MLLLPQGQAPASGLLAISFISFGEIHVSVFPQVCSNEHPLLTPNHTQSTHLVQGTGLGCGDPEMDAINSCPPDADSQEQMPPAPLSISQGAQ